MADDAPDFAGSTVSSSMWGDTKGIASVQTDPIPKESAPPSSATGFDATDDAKTLRENIDSQQALVNEKIKANEKFSQEEEESRRMRDEGIKRLQETLQMPNDTPPPQQMDFSKLDRGGLQAVNQTGPKWQSIVGLGLAIAGMIGKHHGGIGSQFFLGSFLESYAKGRQSAMKEQRDEWWKQVEYEYKVNQDRLANYRAALEDQRLNLAQKMDLLKTYADIYGDAKTSAAASRQDLTATAKILVDYRNALKDYLKNAAKTGRASDYFTKNQIHKEWADAAVGKYLEAHRRPPSNEQEAIDSLIEYPWSQWRNDQMTYRGTDEQGNPKVVPKYPEQEQKQTSEDKLGSYNKALDQSLDDLGDLYGR